MIRIRQPGRARIFCFGILLGSILGLAAVTAWSGEAQVSIGDASIPEGNSGTSNLNFTVTRTGDTSSNLVIQYNSAAGLSNPATPGTDYTAASQGSILRIPAGATSGIISIPVLGDTAPESDEDLLLQLTQAAAFNPVLDLPGAGSSFNTGSAPASVATGDLDGDGKPELVIANASSDTVSVLLNTSSGGTLSFATKQDFATGTNPQYAAIGDVDGDGKPDLVIANNTSGTVSVLLNTSSGGTLSFATKQDFATGTNPQHVAIGDLDGDGKLELVIANKGSNTVSVLRNTSSLGAPSFTKQDFATGTGPFSAAIGDVDGDTKPDLAIANIGSNSVSVLRNTTSGGTLSFDTKLDFGTGGAPTLVAIGDLDGDGKPELATANFFSQSVSVLRNTSGLGAVSFATKQDTVTGPFPDSVAMGDVDGDGKPDLAIANRNGNTISVLRNISSVGAVSFAAKQDFVTGTGAFSVAMGDVDGDGKPELSIANNGSNTVLVLRNNSSSGLVSFATKLDFGTGSNPQSVATGDLDGDGKPELVIANSGSDTVSVLRNISNSGTLGFATKQDLTTGIDPTYVAIGDVDGDGKPDLVVANGGSNTVSVLRNISSGGTLSFAAKQDFATGSNPQSVAIGDLDGDGRPDLAITNSISFTVSVLHNTSSSTAVSFAAKQDFATGSSPFSIAIGDLDGDGKPELAIANRDSDTVSVLRNTSSSGAVSFAAKQDFTTGSGSGPYGVAIGDLDGDGRPELVTSNNLINTVSVLRNTSSIGAVNFAARQDFATGSIPIKVAIGDLDGDGKPELATANGGSNTVSVLRNTSSIGAVSLVPKQDFATGSFPYSVAMGDLDGNGAPELVTANLNSNTVSVLQNSAGFTATLSDNEAVGTILDDDTDTAPDNFSFYDQDTVPLSSVRQSNTITLSGINVSVPVSITGGDYSKNGAGYTNAVGTAVNGDTFRVRHTSSSLFSTATDTTLTISSASDIFTSTTLDADTTPDAFNFTPVTGANPGASVTSTSITVSGLNGATNIAVAGDPGAAYSINGGAFTSANGSINNGNAVAVRVNASASGLTGTSATLTIGGVDGSFNVTTAAIDAAPNAFSFDPVTDADLGSTANSNSILVSGINVSATVIGDAGLSVCINFGGCTSSYPQFVSAGDIVNVQLTSSASPSTNVTKSLNIGGVTGSFSVTTRVGDITPNGFSFTPITGVALKSVQVSNSITIGGVDGTTSIQISGDPGAAYSINGGSFTTLPGNVSNGDSVQVEVTASTKYSTTTSATVGIGGVLGSFTVTTGVVNITPTAFSFISVTNVTPNTLRTSNTIHVAGIKTPISISISGDPSAGYSINGGAYTNGPGTITNGKTITLQLISSATPSTRSSATLHLGTVLGTYNVITSAALPQVSVCPLVPQAVCQPQTGASTLSFSGSGATGSTSISITKTTVDKVDIGNPTTIAGTDYRTCVYVDAVLIQQSGAHAGDVGFKLDAKKNLAYTGKNNAEKLKSLKATVGYGTGALSASIVNSPLSSVATSLSVSSSITAQFVNNNACWSKTWTTSQIASNKLKMFTVKGN